MNPAARVVLGLVTVLLLGPACGATTTSSQSPMGSSTTDNGKLDPAVAMPNGFPSDFPVYPGARLIRANHVTSNGQTGDSLAAVHSFYMSRLNQGDWTISFNSSGSGGYSAIFTRKSNPKDAGLLTVEVESNVTHIRLGFGTTS